MTDDLKLRRRKSYELHAQGFVYRAIAEMLEVSESTVGNDVQWIEAEQERQARVQPPLRADSP